MPVVVVPFCIFFSTTRDTTTTGSVRWLGGDCACMHISQPHQLSVVCALAIIIGVSLRLDSADPNKLFASALSPRRQRRQFSVLVHPWLPMMIRLASGLLPSRSVRREQANELVNDVIEKKESSSSIIFSNLTYTYRYAY